MTKDDCKRIAEQAAQETNLVKRGVLFNKASQCYKENEEAEQFKAIKMKAIDIFHQIFEETEDPYEKSLFSAYEALCWVCLEEFETATGIMDVIMNINKPEPTFKVPPLVNFTYHLARKEIEKAEELWKEIYLHFSHGIIDLLKEAFITVNPSSEPPVIEKPVIFSKIWTILFAGKDPNDPQKDWTLTFYDVHDFFEDKVVLNKKYMDDLLDQVKELEHYRFIRNMRSVTSSSGEDLTSKAMFICLATSSEKKLKFGMLLGTLKDGGVHVIGLWPEAFAQAVVKDEDIIGAFITRSVKNPEWFSDLNVLSFITDEKKPEEEEIAEGEDALPGYFT
ncbi:MAG: hypothetical protein HWN65_13320 [Candidatus Helarchaeota archaeon]|nr:hypothetical protein [Candidatus Helarchaeota archaeon]